MPHFQYCNIIIHITFLASSRILLTRVWCLRTVYFVFLLIDFTNFQSQVSTFVPYHLKLVSSVCSTVRYSCHSLYSTLGFSANWFVEAVVYIGVHSFCCEVLWVLTKAQCQISITTDSFITLRYPLCFICSSLSHSPPQNTHNHSSVYHLYRFSFYKVSYKWNQQDVALSDWLLLLCNMHLRFNHIFTWLNSLFIKIAKQHFILRYTSSPN